MKLHSSLLLCSLLYTLSVNCKAASIDNLIADKTTGIRSEIIRNVIDPCVLKKTREVLGLTELSDSKVIVYAKSLEPRLWENLIKQTIPVVQSHDMDTRKQVYILMLVRCIRGNG